MKNLVYTKSFMFSNARYVLGDGNGNEILLSVNYRNNNYSKKVLKRNGGGYRELTKEVENIALDLLARKSAKNFAKK